MAREVSQMLSTKPGQVQSGVKAGRTAHMVYRSRDASRAGVFDYIERFYNPRQRHSKLGYLSPVAFEARAMQT